MNSAVTPADISAEDLPGWAVHSSPSPHLLAVVRTGTFAVGLEFVNRVGALAEAANHHPDMELTYPRVTIMLRTHEAGGLTTADVELARQISAVAAEMGRTISPTT